MNNLVFMNLMKEAFSKEATLRPYKQPTFSQDELSTPVQYGPNIPPFMRGNAPVVTPRATPSTPKAEPTPPSSNASESNLPPSKPRILPNSAINVQQWLAGFIFKFNKMLSGYTSYNPITPDQIFDMFLSFVDEEAEMEIGPDRRPLTDEEIGRKQEALTLFEKIFKDKFEESKRKSLSGEEDVAQTPQEQKYPDLTKQQVIALFQRNRALQEGKGKTNRVFDTIAQMPQFTHNDHNLALLKEVQEEFTGSTISSGVDDASREELKNLFLKSYLSGNDKESLIRYKMLLGEPLSSRDRDIVLQSRLNRGDKSKSFVNSKLLADADSIAFIKDKLFSADANNKELFLSFFLEPYAKQSMLDSIGPDLDPGENEILGNIGKSGYDANAMNVVHRHFEPLVQELKSIMSDKDNPLHHKFFDWVLQEAVRSAQSDKSQEMQWAADAGSANEKDPFAITPDRDFKTDFRLELGESVFKEEGLQPEGLPVQKGDTVEIDKLQSLQNNWNKLSSFITDVNGKLAQFYERTPLTKETKDQKVNALRKMLLWSRIQESCRKSVAQTVEAAKRGIKDLTDERMINILNQDWSELFKLEHLADDSFALDNPDVAGIIQKAVADKLFANPRQAYDEILTSSAVEYPPNMQVGSRKDPAYNQVNNTRNILKQKAYGDLESLRDVLLDPELINKYGNDTMVSFVEVIGFFPETAAVGSLLAKTNRGSFDDKMNYLTQLARRGVDLGKTEEEIEAMTPQEITATFDKVRDILETMYSTPTDIEKKFSDPGSFIKDEYVAQFAVAAGLNNVKGKADFAKLPRDSKKRVIDEFDKSEYKKYYVDQSRELEALRVYLERYIEQSMDNPAFLARNKLESKDQFLKHIGITPGQISNSIKEMPDRRLFQIAERYFPDLRDAYNRGLVKKTLVHNKPQVKVDELVKSMLRETPQEEAIDPKGKRPYGPSRLVARDALFFAELLDAGAAGKIASRIRMMQKIAQNRRVASLVSLRGKFAKFNVDTSVLDAIIAGAINGRQQSLGSF